MSGGVALARRPRSIVRQRIAGAISTDRPVTSHLTSDHSPPHELTLGAAIIIRHIRHPWTRAPRGTSANLPGAPAQPKSPIRRSGEDEEGDPTNCPGRETHTHSAAAVQYRSPHRRSPRSLGTRRAASPLHAPRMRLGTGLGSAADPPYSKVYSLVSLRTCRARRSRTRGV